VEEKPVASNLNLDDKLLAEAKRLGKHRTKRDAVNHALAEYVLRKRRKRILALVHSVEWDPDYDYKAERRKR
jgi:Arc/MetJ family transcription regulator